MTARTNSSRQDRRVTDEPGQHSASVLHARSPLSVAVLLVVSGAILRAVGPFLPMVQPNQPPGFTSAPLHVVLALLPAVLAVLAAARGQVDAAARVLVVVAVFAPGQLFTDLQLGINPSRSSRPDLALPMSLTPVGPGIGLWLLLAGHLVVLGAGVVALLWLRSTADDPAFGPHRSDVDGPESGRQGTVAVALSVGTLAGIALLLSEPFESADLFQLARSPLEQPFSGFLGGVLLVLAAPVAAAFATGSDGLFGRRVCTFACALALITVALPQLLVGLSLDGFGPAWGPPVVLGCAAVLFVVGMSGTRGAEADGPAEDVHLPGAHRLNLATGVLGALTGVACALAGLLGQVTLPPGLLRVPSYADRLLIPAGLLVIVVSAVMLFGVLAPPVPRPGQAPRPSRIPPAVRPVLLVAIAVVPFAATTALDGALAATEVRGSAVGFGAVLALSAVLGALATVIVGGLAGGEEREDVDLSERAVRPVLLAVAVPAVLAALGAFGLPMFSGPEYSSPALLGEFSLGWWGLAVAVCTVIAAAGLATSSRRARGCALFLGAAAVLGVRLLELPLTVERVPGATLGFGTWCAAIGIVALSTGAVLAVLGADRDGTAEPYPDIRAQEPKPEPEPDGDGGVIRSRGRAHRRPRAE